MTLDKNSPALLARIGAWGRPWHGLAKGGEVTLPNSTTRDHAQPAGNWHWEHGACHLLRRPGYPQIERDEDQQVADTDAGKEWRNYALICGGASMLYGKNLGSGRFVWIDQDEDRWLVDASALHDQTWTAGTIPASVDITIRRFGVFGLIGDPMQISVTMPDLGQSSPDVYTSASVVATEFASSLYSLHPQGRRAAFMLHYQILEGASPSGWPGYRHPCGWYELQLSGNGTSPSISIGRIADRLETLGGAGVYSVDEQDPAPGGTLWVKDRTEYSEDYNFSFPDCAGSYDQIRAAAIGPADSPLAGDGYTMSWWSFPANPLPLIGPAPNVSVEYSFEGMLMAVWYDATGEPKLATLDLDWSRNDVSATTGADASDERVRTFAVSTGESACQATLTTTQDYAVTVSQIETSEETMLMRWEVNGVTVSSIEVHYAGEKQEILSFSSDGLTEDWSKSSSGSFQLTGGGWDTEDSATGEFEFSADQEGSTGNDAGVFLGNVMWGGNVAPGRRALELTTISVSYWAQSEEQLSRRFTPVRLGHAVLGWLRSDFRGEEWEWAIHGDVVTPEGLAAFPAWSIPHGDVPQLLFVSRQPHDNEIHVDTAAACWV